MNSAFFIINPKAGRKSSKDTKLRIFDKFNIDVTNCIFTEYAGHATILAKKAIDDGYKHIIAVGGDGTVNEIATALLHTDCILGIIPMGSGNGLARELGFSMKAEICIEQIKKSIEYQTYKKIDVGILDFSDQRKYFFCTAGIGFDAHCAAVFAASPTKRGLWNYIRVGLQEFWNYKHPEIKYNGEEKTVFSLTFANAKQFGNNAYIAPNAKTNDGLLNVTELIQMPIWVSICMSWRLFNKTLRDSTYVKINQGKHFMIESDNKIVAHYDGDPLIIDKKLKISILSSSLNILKVD